MSNASEKAPMPAREKGRFAKGSSGNPKGRPKKVRSDAQVDLGLSEVLSEPVTLREGDRFRTMPRGRALMMVLTNMALAGDAKAYAPLTALLKHQKLIDPAPPEQLRGGVLVVPGIMDEETWERRAAAEQAPYRGNCGDPRTTEDKS